MPRKGVRVAKLLAEMVEDSDAPAEGPASSGATDSDRPAPSGEGDAASKPSGARRPVLSRRVLLVAAAVTTAACVAVIAWRVSRTTEGTEAGAPTGSTSAEPAPEFLVIRAASLHGTDRWGERETMAQLEADGRVLLDGTLVGTLRGDGRFVDQAGQVRIHITQRGSIIGPTGELAPFLIEGEDTLRESHSDRRGALGDDGVLRGPWGPALQTEGCLPDARRTCLGLLVIGLTLPPEAHLGVPSIEFCGAKHPPGAKQLTCHDPTVADLTPLSQLLRLKSLDLGQTAAAELSPLAKLASLRVLVLDNTKVSDLRPLAALTGLRALSAAHTAVADLTPLAKLAALRSLSLAHTAVEDLAGVGDLTMLQSLMVPHTKVSDLAPLTGLTKLQLLSLSATPVQDLKPLVELSALQQLWLKGTRIEALDALHGLSALRYLDVSETEVPATQIEDLKKARSGLRIEG